MLISRVEEEEGLVKGQEASESNVDDSHDYQNASELFDLMAKRHNFQSSETESLTTRDLILLYKNIDLGTKLMSSANEFKRNIPNQYVETVVYREDSDSDLSEICSNEDLHNVILINKERLDLLENSSSTFGNTLCHKFGDLEIHSSNLTKAYEKKFVKGSFNDMQRLDILSTSKYSPVLPGSLFDYIGCKRLEDNSFSFYMDSVIRYVNNTIDHLKRISDGEYLTDKAKKKWKEVDRHIKDIERNKSLVLSNSVNIPLHVEPKLIENRNTWKDIIHSEVNLKSLSKILQKKIVVEVPKNICGSFKLFSKCFDNVVMEPKKKQQSVLYYDDKKRESRVDLVLRLTQSKSGHVLSKISSITISQKNVDNDRTSNFSPLPYEDCNIVNVVVSSDQKGNIPRMVEKQIWDVGAKNDYNKCKALIEAKNHNRNNTDKTVTDNLDRKNLDDAATLSSNDRSVEASSDLDDTTGYGSSLTDRLSTYQGSSESSLFGIGHKWYNRFKPASSKASSDDHLKLTIQRLNTQCSLPEESLEELACSLNKKNTPTRYRMKSPYENKSHAIEERKRKKLLEIRQRREKRKIAMIETYKSSKSKHGKEFMAQPSSSVTKLSITNKSFYNSIYGQSSNDKLPKIKSRKQKKDSSFEEASDTENDHEGGHTPDINSQKYINKNYFLDDTVTEMMYIEMNQKESDQQILKSESLLSNDFRTKLDILNQLITTSITDLSVTDTPTISPLKDFSRFEVHDETERNNQDQETATNYLQEVVNAPSEKFSKNIKFQFETEESKKSNRSSIEFRKSIDKIYELMNKLGKVPDSKLCKSKFTAVETSRDYGSRQSSPTIEYDESVKDQPPLSPNNMSKENVVSAEKPVSRDLAKSKNTNPQNPQSPSAIVPKIVISTKSQTPKGDGERAKKERKKINPTKAASENPLKAISQILHDFDNVQKTRQKTITSDNLKKSEITSGDGKVVTRQSYTKKPFADIRTSLGAREKRTKSSDPKLHHQQPPTDDKQMNRSIKKQVADLMDEFKEARGEAIRGPKPSARLNSLAQPKRTYVQAQIEDFQARHGKSVMSDRLLRLTGSPSLDTSVRNRFRRVDATVKHSPAASAPPPSERTPKPKFKPFSSSRETKTPQSSNEKLLKQHNLSELSGAITKKMVAVESYLKNHYGRLSPLADNNELLLRSGQKMRTPHLPTNIKLPPVPSLLEDNCFRLEGNKFHTADNLTPCETGLAVLTECNETTSEHSRDLNEESDLNDLLIEGYLRNNFESAVHDTRQFIMAGNTLKQDLYVPPICTIEKQLKIKHFSMLPKDQMQKIYQLVLQSDNSKSSTDSSILDLEYRVTSTVNNAISKSPYVVKSKSNVIKDVTTLAELTKIDFANFPVTIPTIGYCFPQYHSVPCNSNSSLVPATGNNSCFGAFECESSKSDKISQCYKGKVEPVIEHAAQTECKSVGYNPTITTSYTCMRPKGKKVLQCQSRSQTIKLKKDPEKVLIERSTEAAVSTLIKTEELPLNTIKSNNSVKTLSTSPSRNRNDVEYTTSLDILVGLLNEIQKITTCQTQITKTQIKPTYSSNNSGDHYIKLENILKETSTVSKASNISIEKKLSIAAIEDLRLLDSKASVCSFYLSNNSDGLLMDNLHLKLDTSAKPNSVDKQVSVELLPRKEFKNRFTDVPSRFLPTGVNHATDISATDTSNSLIGILSKPSTQSMLKNDDHIFHSNASFSSVKKIIDLENQVQSGIVFEKTTKEILKVPKKSSKKANCATCKLDNKNEMIAIYTTKKLTPNCTDCVESEFDPIMKMKRDLLVTMYSVLVFTVFAALSFPEMLYRS